MRTITFLLVLITLLSGAQTLSAISWIGQGQTNAWSDPGNWSGNHKRTGVYDIIVRVKNLCEDTVSITVPNGGSLLPGAPGNVQTPQFESAADLRESVLALTMFPNPARDVFNLFVDNEFESGSIRVFDLGGRLILSQELAPDTGEYQFDLGGWQSGVYFVRVQLDKRSRLSKLVVETQ